METKAKQIKYIVDAVKNDPEKLQALLKCLEDKLVQTIQTCATRICRGEETQVVSESTTNEKERTRSNVGIAT